MDKMARKDVKKKKYQKPGIIFEKKIEVISAACASGFGGIGGCRTMGSCARARV